MAHAIDVLARMTTTHAPADPLPSPKAVSSVV
jgi:hypothetical protein